MLCLFILAKCVAFTGMIHVRVRIKFAPKSSSPQSSESAQCENTETPYLRTLMDLQRLENFFPRLQISEKIDMFTQFIESGDEEIGIVSAVKLSQNEICRPVNGKIILTDLLLTLFKSIIAGVRPINLDAFNLFIPSVRQLLWYVAPHHVKSKDRSCTLPSQLIRFCGLNNPKKLGHRIKQIDSVVLEDLIGGLATQLEKSYVEHPNFHPLRDLATALLTAATKYASYLAENNLLQKRNQSEEEKTEKQQLINELKHIESSTHYKIARERKAIEAIQQDLDSRDFYNPVNVDVHFPEKRIYRYDFVKNVTLIGFPNHSITLLLHYFRELREILISCGEKILTILHINLIAKMSSQ